MEYPMQVTINLVFKADGTIDVQGEDGKPLVAVDNSDIRALYERPGGVRHVGELIYDDRAAAGACCLYQYINGQYVCVRRC